MTSRTPFTADFETLDFDAIREHLARETRTPYGRELARDLLPSADPSEVRYRLRLTTEARHWLAEQGGFGMGELPDVRPLLERLRLENATLTVDEIHALARTMEAGLHLRATLRPHRERFPRLGAIAETIPDFRDTLAQVRRIVAPDGQLDERASPELQRLRQEQQVQRDRLQRRLERLLRRPDLEGVFSDDIVTQRHGRFVIPVRDDHRGRVAGVVHGMSGSGMTAFVEPLDAIPLNNELTRLQELIEAEVLRLLQEATQQLRHRQSCLTALVTALGELDLVVAKARLAERLRAVEPTVSETGRFQLTAARHPLLMLTFQAQGREVVPLSLTLDAEQRALVVSGANAGGKTVVLKTVGLCVLLAQSGLHVPAQAAELPVLRQVYADIGDQQSLAANLSTFSSHITKLARMAAELTPPALVLLDEAGTGTDPDEGAALAQALIEHFRTRGAYVLATTHFNALKIYADSTPGVISAAVAFDLETLTPTYQLHLNAVGSSSGLVIARRLGLPEALIEQAQSYLREREVILAQYVAELERRVTEARDAAAALDEERAALAERYARLEQEFLARDAARQADFEARVQQLTAAFESRLASLLERISEAETRERLRREAVRQLEATAADVKADAKAGKPLDKPSLAAEVAARRPQKSKTAQRALVAESLTAQPVRTAADLRPGDRVRTAFGTVGQVEAISGEEVTVTSGALRLKVPATTLAKLPPAKSQPTPSAPPARQTLVAMHDVTLEGQVPSEINLIGLTTDEATDALDRYLDRAVLAGLTQVRVIHGVGTGALRKAVETFLLTHPHVESFARADRRQGGDGATLVSLHP
ncbi:endonuclease MutS2 [Chloracidobacterium thermophilum]|uniref:Endonuclease MutS2 n=1 Tax=Chloracidobacterium thermophilum (strain B) TaxID=981222 RepID=G2LGJ6_CHLTF|nr:Smr/MutS family protein [Chloracidobacterium thermophilum]AEP10956.1 MutS2 family protein [Chloracidobacterium thermophilum B]QUV78883.1 Smr/MutS family protein [Chloracidobacterium thermophilum]